MSWTVLALATAVFYAVHGAWAARMARWIGPGLAGWATFTGAIPILAAYLVIQGVPEIGPRFWMVCGVNTVLHLAGWYMFLAALRTGDLGIAFPLLALTPVFVVPIEWVLLRETPSAPGLLGVALVVAGVYLLNIQERQHGPLAPLRALARDRATVRILGVAVLWSLTGTLDRVAVLEASPALYGVFLSIGLSLGFLPIAWRARVRDTGPAAALGERFTLAGVGGMVLLGLLFSAMFIVQMEALTQALAAYVLSIKRTGALLAVVIGYVAFRERALGPRLVGTVVTLVGAAVLVFWSA